MKSAFLVACAGIGTFLPAVAGAQTAEQLRLEAAFVRAVIEARDAHDCPRVLRLIDERKIVLEAQLRKFGRTARPGTLAGQAQLSYLVEQIRGLENRRAIVRRECT